MLAEIRAKNPFNGQRARLTVDGALPTIVNIMDWLAARRALLRTVLPRANISKRFIHEDPRL